MLGNKNLLHAPTNGSVLEQTQHFLDFVYGNHSEGFGDLIQKTSLPSRSEYCVDERNDFTSDAILDASQCQSEKKQFDVLYQDKSGDWKFEEEFRLTMEQSLNEKKSMEKSASIGKIKSYNQINGDVFKDAKDRKQTAKARLFNVRDRLASYQESKGVPRTQYPFWELVKVISQITIQLLTALHHTIVNVVPSIVEIFLYALRFILDKLIDIKLTNDTRQVVLKWSIFAIQFFAIYVSLTFIVDIIFLPIVYMVLQIVVKILF